MIRAKLEAAHVVCIHEEGWKSIRGWRHGFRQMVDLVNSCAS
jgi:hypothetical protein